MTTEKALEMAKMIEGMHGLDNREEQRFFFDGKIFYYNMRYMADYYDAWLKDSKNRVWRFVYDLDNKGNVTNISVEVCYVKNELKSPVKRNF